MVGKQKKPVVELSLVPGENSDVNKLGLIWNCTNITSSFMDFQVFYEHADQISVNGIMEKINIIFHGKKYFAGTDG